MTAGAIVFKVVAHMVWVANLFIIILMAGPALRRGILIAARMAVGALHVRVLASQRENRQVVIEHRRSPARRCVTAGTVCKRLCFSILIERKLAAMDIFVARLAVTGHI